MLIKILKLRGRTDGKGEYNRARKPRRITELESSDPEQQQDVIDISDDDESDWEVSASKKKRRHTGGEELVRKGKKMRVERKALSDVEVVRGFGADKGNEKAKGKDVDVEVADDEFGYEYEDGDDIIPTGYE